MKEQFLALVAELDGLLGGGPADDFADGEFTSAQVTVDGTDFVLGQGEATPGLFTVHCRVAPLAGSVDEEILLRFLAKNVDLASRSAGSLGVTLPGRDLVYSWLAAVQGTTAQQLLAGLRKCAGMAKAWREELLASSEPPAPAQPAISVAWLV